MKRSRRWATWFVVFALVVGGGAVVFWPTNFFRQFDAAWNPLVATQAEAYCAGLHGIPDRFMRDDPKVIDCMANSGYDNTTPDMGMAVHWSCQGIQASGWSGSTAECKAIFDGDQLWLIVGGGLTNDWNTGHPRPSQIDSGVLPDEDRGSSRGDLGVPYPTSGTTEGE